MLSCTKIRLVCKIIGPANDVAVYNNQTGLYWNRTCECDTNAFNFYVQVAVYRDS